MRSLLWLAPIDLGASLGDVSSVRGSSLKFIGQAISWFNLNVTKSPVLRLLCPQLQLFTVSPIDPSTGGTTVDSLCFSPCL